MENSGILNREKLGALIKRKGVLSESIARTNKQKKILREFKEQNDDICLKIDYLISEGFITEKQVAKLMREAAIFVIENNRQVVNENVYHSDFIGESLILERVYNQINESWLGDKWNSAKNWVSNSAKKVADVGKNVVNGAVNVGKNVVNGAVNVGKKVVNRAADMAKSSWKWAKNRWENLDIRLALKDGVLPDEFECDAIEITSHNGQAALLCHNTRRMVRSEDFILLPNGVGIYPKNNNQRFKWTSAMAVKVSLKDAVINGAFLGSTFGAGLSAVAGIAGGSRAIAVAAGKKAMQSALKNGATKAAANRAAQAAIQKSMQKGALGMTRGMRNKVLSAGLNGGFAKWDINALSGEDNREGIAGARDEFTQNGLIGNDGYSSYDYAEAPGNSSYDYAEAPGNSGGGYEQYDYLFMENKQRLNEFAITTGLILTAAGAIGGGIYSAIRNQGNIVYYSDGSYRSKNGKESGRWDGTVEAQALAQKKGGQVNENKNIRYKNIEAMNDEYELLREFINSSAKESINEFNPFGAIKKGINGARNFIRGGKQAVTHADDAAKATKNMVSHSDDAAKAAKRASELTKNIEHWKAGISGLRKEIAATRQQAQAALKRSEELFAKAKSGTLNKQALKTTEEWALKHQKTNKELLAKIAKKEKELAKLEKNSKAAQEQLKALQTVKKEAQVTLRTTEQVLQNTNRARKLLGMAVIGAAGLGIGSLIGSNSSDGSSSNGGSAGGGAADGGADGGASVGGSTNSPSREEIIRVSNMQNGLNNAGYTDQEGNKLKVDGLLGPRTEYAAKEAGIDPKTWNGTPEIKPKQQNNPEQQQQQQQQQQGQEQQQGFDYSSDAAYGKYLGGADARDIKKFQYDFGIEPETGVYDAKTARKAYELAHDTNDNNFKRAGGTIKAYANWNAYEAGGNAANAQHAQNAATEAFNSALQTLNTSLDRYGKGNPAANERLNNIRNFVKGNDFDGAMQAANSLAQPAAKKTIMQQISQCKQAYEAARKPAMNEIKEKFYDIFDRMNNATILQG